MSDEAEEFLSRLEDWLERDEDSGSVEIRPAVVDSHQLRVLAATANALDFECRLDPRINVCVDDGGLHIVNIISALETEAHGKLLRCSLMVKVVRRKLTPVECYLDVRLRDYVVLRPIPRERFRDDTPSMRTTVVLKDLIPDEFTPERYA